MPLVENEQNAAQEHNDDFIIDGGVEATNDQVNNESEVNAPITESAPVENEAVQEAEKPTDNFQTRINKVTADKYAEKRRADELQAKLDQLNNKPVEKEAKAPTLEDHEYDDEAFNKANISYQVQQELAKQRSVQQQEQVQAKAQQEGVEFNKRIADFGKEDFADKANAIPVLPDGVADALIQAANGPEMIYFLGTHLDQADALANMTAGQALMEIGRISANMSAPKEKKSSAAPDPIETLSSGSVVSKERGPLGATYD